MKLPPDNQGSGMEMFNQLLKQAGGAQVLQNAQSNAEQVVQRLEMALISIDQAVQKIAFQLDHTRLTVSMILNIIEENNILTKEQIQEKYEKDVVAPIRQIETQLKEEMQKQTQENLPEEPQGDSLEDIELKEIIELEEIDEENDGEPILASERAGTKKVF